MSSHCGTHTDAPLHFVQGAPAIADVALDAYLGPCRVIDVTSIGEPPLVDPRSLAREHLAGAQRILLRTARTHDGSRFDPRFTALGTAAARALVDAGIRLVGVDTPSMDHASSRELEAHHLLLEGGVAILENIDLSCVEPGEYELIALPLRIVGGDSSPVRAILRELPSSR